MEVLKNSETQHTRHPAWPATSPFPGQPYLFCPGDVAAPHSIKFFKTPHRSWIGLFLIPFSLRQTLSLLLSLVTPCRDLSQSTAQHKLHTTTPTSAGHIATVPPHCSASATTLRATHGPVGS